MKKTFLIIQMLICATICFAQESVTILVSGEGKTKTEATDAALRSAIEQTFGAFVSANTTILSDEIVKDEVATVSSGNIEKYTEVNYFERNGKSYITLNATISIGKLISYAKSKGSSCEFAGATVTAEIRKINFYKKNTIKALENLHIQLKALAPDCFDIIMEQPNVSADGTVSITVKVIPNKNMDNLEQLILTTLKGLAMDFEEPKHLESLNVTYYRINYRVFLEDGDSKPKKSVFEQKGKAPYYYYENLTDFVYLYDFIDPEIELRRTDRRFINLYDSINKYNPSSFLQHYGPNGEWDLDFVSEPFNYYSANDIFADFLSHIYVVDNLGNSFPVSRSSIPHLHGHFTGAWDGSGKRDLNFCYNAKEVPRDGGHFSPSYKGGDLITAGVTCLVKTKYDLETLSKITGFTTEIVK